MCRGNQPVHHHQVIIWVIWHFCYCYFCAPAVLEMFWSFWNLNCYLYSCYISVQSCSVTLCTALNYLFLTFWFCVCVWTWQNRLTNCASVVRVVQGRQKLLRLPCSIWLLLEVVVGSKMKFCRQIQFWRPLAMLKLSEMTIQADL